MQDTMTMSEDKSATLQLPGDVVAGSIADLRATMRSIVAGGARELTLDFSNVRMIDSCGIGLLVAAHNSLQKAGGRLSVVHVTREILDLFRTMRIHQHLNVSAE
jgi:anti-anti-sigma factor